VTVVSRDFILRDIGSLKKSAKSLGMKVCNKSEDDIYKLLYNLPEHLIYPKLSLVKDRQRCDILVLKAEWIGENDRKVALGFFGDRKVLYSLQILSESGHVREFSGEKDFKDIVSLLSEHKFLDLVIGCTE
jgi:hypothetical protein